MSQIDSWTERHRPLVAAAALGAQALHGEAGFRLRDLRFLLELFLNWLNYSWEDLSRIQNTQLLRVLNRFVDEGYARKRTKGNHPRYVLTRGGFLSLLEAVRYESKRLEPEAFLFRFMFLEVYMDRILAVIKGLGKEFSPSLEREVTRLCSPSTLLSEEIKRVEELQQRIAERINDASHSFQLVQRLQREQRTSEEIIEAVESNYPYELSNQRSLTEILLLIPESHRLQEVSVAADRRAKVLWGGQAALLSSYQAFLQSLR